MRAKGTEPLAESLGCDQRTLTRWRKLAGAPLGSDVEEWRAFMEANGLGRVSSKTKTQLQEEKLREEIALLKIKREQAEGSTVSVDAMGDFIARFSAKLDQLLTQKMQTEIPPRVQGKDIVAIRAEMRLAQDEMREIYNAGLLEWKAGER